VNEGCRKNRIKLKSEEKWDKRRKRKIMLLTEYSIGRTQSEVTLGKTKFLKQGDPKGHFFAHWFYDQLLDMLHSC
jgi:hypothetical protein